jgi:hypothetical protein
VLVQKSVTTITNAAGRLSDLDARESCKDAQDPSRKKLAFRLPATFPFSAGQTKGHSIVKRRIRKRSSGENPMLNVGSSKEG